MRSLSIILVLALGASAHKHPRPPCPVNQIMNHGRCVSPCRDREVLIGRQCVCAPGTEKDEKGNCQPIECPPGLMLINNHCQSPCPDPKLFLNGRCVCPPGTEDDDKDTCQPIECPPGLMLINYHCQPPCPDQQYLLNGECVCFPGKEKSADGTCKTICPPGKNLLADDSCSPLPCREDQIEINGRCVCPCSPGKILVEGTCSYPPCPNNLERIDDKCGCKLPAIEVSGNSCGESKCFTPDCPRGEIRQADGTCRKICEDGYHLVKGVCEQCLPDEEWISDSEKCVPICPNGERLDRNIDECVCEDGLTRQPPDYTCKPRPPQPDPEHKEKCPSGIQTGKCYTFTFPNGQLLGFNRKSDSYIASNTQFGKFSLCTDIECAPDLPIEAGARFHIHDLIQGDLGQGRKSWLSDDRDGAYITRTPRWDEAADFVIARWPGGKHCLGGLENGVGLIKADDGGSVGATMLTRDDQSCVLVTLTEVPCDIRAGTANCFGCNKTDTSVSCPPDGKVANASMPIDGSGVSGHQ